MNDLNRQIYIGDMIQLTVDRGYASEKEILDAFRDLEVVSIKETDQVYEVTLRSFEPGVFKTELAGRQVEIVVASTLETLNRETLFEPEPLAPETFKMPYMTLMFAAAALGMIAFIAYIAMHFTHRKKKQPTAYESFISTLEAPGVETGDLAIVTRAFKEYLHNSGWIVVQGNTTDEVPQAVFESSIDQEIKNEIRDCLEKSDAIHYRPDKGSKDIIEGLRAQCYKLAKILNESEKEVML